MWKLLHSNHKFTLRPCWVITQFKPSCHWSHTPMADTLTILLTFFSDNQDTWFIIHDATGLPNDLNKYLFLYPIIFFVPWPSLCRNSFSSIIIAIFSLKSHIETMEIVCDMQMTFSNYFLLVWQLLYFDYIFSLRPKQNGHLENYISSMNIAVFCLNWLSGCNKIVIILYFD